MVQDSVAASSVLVKTRGQLGQRRLECEVLLLAAGSGMDKKEENIVGSCELNVSLH